MKRQLIDFKETYDHRNIRNNDLVPQLTLRFFWKEFQISKLIVFYTVITIFPFNIRFFPIVPSKKKMKIFTSLSCICQTGIKRLGNIKKTKVYKSSHLYDMES